MTPEELQVLVEELKAEKESMAKKNQELLAEVKKERSKNKEIDADVYHRTLDELESVKAEKAKLESEVKLKAKDFEKLSASLNEKDGALQGLLIDQGLTQALTEAGVPAHLLKFVKADLKSQAKLQSDNGQYTALIGDKPLNDFIAEWKNADGKNVIIAPTNTGGGSQGGNGSGGNGKTASRSQFEGYSPAEQMSFVKAGGTITE